MDYEAAIEAAKQIRLAQEAAAAQVSESTAVQTSSPTVPAPASGGSLSMDDLASGGLSVDAWLKVKPYGLLVGVCDKLFDNIDVEIDMNAVMPNKQIKATRNGTTKYWKTFDGINAASGGSWMAAMAEAQAMQSNAFEYRSADLPMVLLNDLQDKAGNVFIKAGQVIGHSLATTNWKLWQPFYTDMKVLGLHNSKVKVRLGFREEKKPGLSWGVITFTKI